MVKSPCATRAPEFKFALLLDGVDPADVVEIVPWRAVLIAAKSVLPVLCKADVATPKESEAMLTSTLEPAESTQPANVANDELPLDCNKSVAAPDGR